MSLFNVQKIQKQLTWLTEQIRCIRLEGVSIPLSALEIPLAPYVSPEEENPESVDILQITEDRINNLNSLEIGTKFIPYFKISINNVLYIISIKEEDFKHITEILNLDPKKINKKILKHYPHLENFEIESIDLDKWEEYSTNSPEENFKQFLFWFNKNLN